MPCRGHAHGQSTCTFLLRVETSSMPPHLLPQPLLHLLPPPLLYQLLPPLLYLQTPQHAAYLTKPHGTAE